MFIWWSELMDVSSFSHSQVLFYYQCVSQEAKWTFPSNSGLCEWDEFALTGIEFEVAKETEHRERSIGRTGIDLISRAKTFDWPHFHFLAPFFAFPISKINCLLPGWGDLIADDGEYAFQGVQIDGSRQIHRLSPC